jgi:hypothetical protein
MTYVNPWLRLNMNLMQLGAESSGVMALRMMRLAAGGAAAAAEAELMVSEKMAAVAAVQAEAWTSLMTGQGHLAPSRAVAHYRRKVRANRRRLAR